EALREAARTDTAIHELAIDGPLPVQAVELESSGYPGSSCSARQGVEGRVGSRIYAVVLDRGACHLELQDQVPCPSRLHCRRGFRKSYSAFSVYGVILGEELAIDSHRPLTVDLVQAVLQIERLTGKLAEVNDDLHALRGTDADALHLDGMGDQVAVGATQEERIGRPRSSSSDVSRQEELVEAGWAGVQQTEPVTTGRNLEEGLDHAIDQELVAQDAIQIEQVEHQLSRVRIEDLVIEHQRDI